MFRFISIAPVTALGAWLLSAASVLRLDMQAGHGMGSTATQRNAMSADIYAFLLWQMGQASLKE